MSTPGLLAIIGAALVVLALAVVGFVGWLRRLSARTKARMYADLLAEPAIRGPERATYRGSTGGYSKVAATGQIALTERSLLFRKVTGGAVDVPLAEISGVRVARAYNRTKAGGPWCLVVRATEGELGYQVSDPDGWKAAICRASPGLGEQAG